MPSANESKNSFEKSSDSSLESYLKDISYDNMPAHVSVVNPEGKPDYIFLLERNLRFSCHFNILQIRYF